LERIKCELRPYQEQLEGFEQLIGHRYAPVAVR
jgi:hypothetical protein